MFLFDVQIFHLHTRGTRKSMGTLSGQVLLILHNWVVNIRVYVLRVHLMWLKIFFKY